MSCRQAKTGPGRAGVSRRQAKGNSTGGTYRAGARGCVALSSLGGTPQGGGARAGRAGVCWYKVHTLRRCFISVLSLHLFHRFAFVRTQLQSDVMTIIAQLQHLAQPRPASPAQSGRTQPAQPSTCPVAFTLSLTDSTRARHTRGTRERLRTLRGRFANVLTTIAGQQLDRASDCSTLT